MVLKNYPELTRIATMLIKEPKNIQHEHKLIKNIDVINQGLTKPFQVTKHKAESNSYSNTILLSSISYCEFLNPRGTLTKYFRQKRKAG